MCDSFVRIRKCDADPAAAAERKIIAPAPVFSVSHGINFRSHRRCFDECTWTGRIQHASKAPANSVSYPTAKSATSVRFSEATFVRRGKCERGSFGRTSRKPSSSVKLQRTRHRIFVIRRETSRCHVKQPEATMKNTHNLVYCT